MRKLLSICLVIIIIFGGILLGVTIAQKAKHREIIKDKPQTLSTQTKVTPTAVATLTILPEIPSQLSIPSINVNADIEQVGLDAQGKMDVPKTHITVGWYSLGFRPGQKGNAVLAGHLDHPSGSPAVFWNLPKLKAGDKIIITDSNRNSYTFSVTHTEKYPHEPISLNRGFWQLGSGWIESDHL